jgi:hypothetical protein
VKEGGRDGRAEREEVTEGDGEREEGCGPESGADLVEREREMHEERSSKLFHGDGDDDERDWLMEEKEEEGAMERWADGVKLGGKRGGVRDWEEAIQWAGENTRGPGGSG